MECFLCKAKPAEVQFAACHLIPFRCDSSTFFQHGLTGGRTDGLNGVLMCDRCHTMHDKGFWGFEKIDSGSSLSPHLPHASSRPVLCSYSRRVTVCVCVLHELVCVVWYVPCGHGFGAVVSSCDFVQHPHTCPHRALAVPRILSSRVVSVRSCCRVVLCLTIFTHDMLPTVGTNGLCLQIWYPSWPRGC